jgi:hypothetical protein
MNNWYANLKKKYQNQRITKSDLKKLLFAIPIACVVTFLFYGISQLYIDSKLKQIKKNKCSTILTVTDVRDNRGSYILFNYTINDETFSSRKPAPFGAFIDANYILNYQCNDPTNISIVENSIFFDKIKSIDTSIAIPKEIEITKYFYSYCFINKNGQLISKKQELNTILTNKIKNKSIRVVYLKEDNNKAILF